MEIIHSCICPYRWTAFVYIKGGEYVQIYLSDGMPETKVEYYRSGVLITHDAINTKNIIVKPGHVLYLAVVTSFGDISWFSYPFPPVIIPMPGSKVELLLREEGEAQDKLGKAVDKELLKIRRNSH